MLPKPYPNFLEHLPYIWKQLAFTDIISKY